MSERTPTAPRLITAAAVSYLCNAAFGAAVATGAIDNRRIRWVHHALYVVTSSLTATALVAGAVERRTAGLALLPAAGPLLALPYAGGRLRRHAAVAGAAAPAYAIALVLAWRNR
ncbi:hypothetical protein [Actinoplanes utahensis]|uniref:Uncharacterized protein n=1 Tax=Actinoplanes utahensis TaxID=1869 RepID=A0A0A6U9J4_ACTUT|nr:hypothetical protein [Actinoplanes utahensis]KHD72066.1 hypothetical protein MB27_42230 [Actinoplanes utahensis]GIF28804.1 hypothetical protein Aut01nite_17900 [Actinoplanes utahensis]